MDLSEFAAWTPLRTRWPPPEGTCNREKWWEDHRLVSIKPSPGEQVLAEETKCRHDTSWMDPHPEGRVYESHEKLCSCPPGCPAGPRCFWCTVCSGTPVSEKLNEEWPPSLVPGLSVFLHTSSSSPYILPARRTVTHANYTVTGEEKTHIFFSPHSSWGFLFICPLFITHSDKEVLSPPTTISPNEISLGWIQFYLNWLDRGAQHIQPILKEIRLSPCTWCKNNQQAKWAWIGKN